MKKIIATMLIGTMLGVPVSAEVQTYSDDYISFEYDDEMIGSIEKHSMLNAEYFTIQYYMNTSIKKDDATDNYACITITSNEQRIKNSKSDGETEMTVRTLISEDPITTQIEYKDDSGIISIDKIVAERPDQCVISSISSNDNESKEYSYCKLFADSAAVSDKFNEKGYDYSDPVDDTEIESEYIFLNKRYSEQAIIYAQKAIDTCNQYLNMEISGKDASDIFEELAMRTDSYKDESEYSSDSDVYDAIFLKDFCFITGEDSEIIKTLDLLQMIVECGTE